MTLITSENQVFLKYFMLHSQNYWSLLKTMVVFLGIIFSSLIYIQSVESAITWTGHVSADMENKLRNKKTCKHPKKRIRAESISLAERGHEGEVSSITQNHYQIQLFLCVLSCKYFFTISFIRYQTISSSFFL